MTRKRQADNEKTAVDYHLKKKNHPSSAKVYELEPVKDPPTKYRDI